jgi:hypothetical protein
MNIDEVKLKGQVEIIIDYDDGRQERKYFQNTVLENGRQALAKCLANEIGGGFSFYINRMTFGSSGTSGGVTKYVDSSRTSLFGSTVVSKPVISTLDPDSATQVVFTSVLSSGEANTTLNEMALQLSHVDEISGANDLYSMATFPDLTKTSSMQITWNWRISFL